MYTGTFHALHRFVRGSNRQGRECFSSCYQAKQHIPDAASGVYCIIVGGNADNKQDLYCDMETMGGGWTLVARGTNANDGCDTDAFGTASVDLKLNSRWSLGDWAINEIGYDQGTQVRMRWCCLHLHVLSCVVVHTINVA